MATLRDVAEEVDVEDLVLAVFYYASGRIPTKTHVVKILAAWARLTGRERQLGYTPYRMGLYSPLVDEAFDNLVLAGYIRPGHGYRLAARAARAAREAAEALERLSPEDAALLRRLARRLRELRTDELLLLHYVLYCSDDCRRASEKWREVEKRRAEIALRMLRRHRASWRLAARLAGMKPDEFAEYAKMHGVPVGDELRIEDIEAAEKDADHIRARLKRRHNS